MNTPAPADNPIAVAAASLSAPSTSTLRDSIRFANGHTYSFQFEADAKGHWAVRILSQPSYGERKDDPHSTKRVERDGSYIINDEQSLISYAEAKTIAEQWARRTERYLEHGIPLSA